MRLRGLGGAGAEQKLAVYRDQLAELGEERRAGRLAEQQYAQARSELENRLIDEMPDADASAPPPQRSFRAAAVAAGVVLPASALVVYLALGNPAAVDLATADGAHGLGQQQVDAMISRLEARLERNPQDAKGWVMLARAQAVLGRFDRASAAYAQSVALFPEDAQLLADYADALGMAQGRRLDGEPEMLVARALRADPDNAKALSLAGTIAFEKKNFALAVQHWERLRRSVPAGSEFAAAVQRNIDEASALADSANASKAGSAAGVSRTSGASR
jgi:cytochrome c-type biogenesis protein CcmH